MIKFKKEKICGIYEIKNKTNGKIYIGLSESIYDRWRSHRNMLNRNCHFNIFLQRAWNKYGEENFEFNIVEKCLKKELSNKEISYIKMHKSNNDKYGYNLSSGGDKPKINKTSLLKKSFKYSKRVLQFTQEGLFIKEYQNARIAAKEYGVNFSLIYQCCNNKIKTACGYIWEYKENCNEDILKNKADISKNYERVYKNNPICQFDINGNFIKEWNSCLDIGRHYKISEENIRSCCNKVYGRKTYIGYIWMYSSEYNKNGINLDDYKHSSNGKVVLQYDLNNNFIAEYQTAREAEKKTGIGYKMISRVCKGKRAHTHKYIFRFKDV